MSEGPKPNHSALLPCPFCGGEAKLWGSTDTEWVQCSTCSAVTDVHSVDSEEAVPAWNKRATKLNPLVQEWLRVELHNARFWCTRTTVEPSAENLAKRDWLEAILGEPIESDPWKDKR